MTYIAIHEFPAAVLQTPVLLIIHCYRKTRKGIANTWKYLKS